MLINLERNNWFYSLDVGSAPPETRFASSWARRAGGGQGLVKANDLGPILRVYDGAEIVTQEIKLGSSSVTVMGDNPRGSYTGDIRFYKFPGSSDTCGRQDLQGKSILSN